MDEKLNRSNFMQPLYLTIDDPNHAQNRIKEVFGFDSKVLLGVIEDGFTARNETTNNHPKIYGGYRHFAEGTAFLRERLLTKGYSKYTQGNSEWVRNEKLGILISFMTGNACVGLKGQVPSNTESLKVDQIARNKNPKGSMFSRIANPQLLGDMLTTHSDIDTWCWVLMYYIDYKNKVIRSELSCPSKLTDNGKFFAEYHERIILKEISFDPEAEFDNIRSPAPTPPSIDFEIRRKNA
ncbi:hypothetical protein AbD4_00710 [Acinetobacter baumannii]|nr:hypothetical protein KPZ59_00619 [Acinetobacter baumannii]QUX86488.1 hypothetical protein AbD4_00710 [Acinetobacter baumannii]CDG77557.1 hypothetical protein ABICBIBUN_03014 [Acinetobacter baumannii 107m]